MRRVDIAPRPAAWRGGGRPLVWIALASLPFFVVDLGAPALNDGEAMYAEIPREMRAGGDWITPRLNGTRHFDKPPLLYWLIGASQAALGETEVAARLWPALAAWATIPVVGNIGGALYGPRAGWLAALVFAASLGPYLYARQVMPDPILSLCIALALLGYVRGYLVRGEGRNAWPWLMYAAIGLAALAKSVLGMGLPLAIIGLHVVVSGRLRTFRSWRTALGIGITAAVAVPWHAAAAAANPDFLGYYVIREHVLRFTGQRYPQDEFLSLPVFLGVTLLWTFPWAPVVPQAVWRAARRLAGAGLRKGEDLLPLLWAAVVVGLFSVSHSRLEYYALPAVPALALLVGRFWDEAMRSSAGGPSPRALGAALGIVAGTTAAAGAAALVVLGPGKDLVFAFVTASWPEAGWVGGPDQAMTLDRIRMPTMISLGGAALLTLGALVAARRARPGLACGLLAGMMVPLSALIHWGFLVVEPYQSSHAVAGMVRRSAAPDDPVVLEEPHEYMWVGGLAFYTKRAVQILKDPKFDGVGARRREPPDRFLDRQELLALWTSGRRVVVVADSGGDLPAVLHEARPAVVVGQSGSQVVLRPSTAGRSIPDAGR